MNQGSASDMWKLEIEKLQRRIQVLAEIQEVVCSALEQPCTEEARQSLEGMLRRHKVKEAQLRQDLAAIQKSLGQMWRGILNWMSRFLFVVLFVAALSGFFVCSELLPPSRTMPPVHQWYSLDYGDSRQ